MEGAYSEYAELFKALYSCVSDSILSGILFGTLLTILMQVYKMASIVKATKRKPLAQRVRLMHPHLIPQDKLDESVKDDGDEVKER